MNELLIPWAEHTTHGVSMIFHDLSQVHEGQLICLITDSVVELAKRQNSDPATILARFLHNYVEAENEATIEWIQRN